MRTDLVSKPPLLFERPELLPRVLEERRKCLPLGVSTNDMQIPRRGRREPERMSITSASRKLGAIFITIPTK